ncbi:arginase family protein [Amycolatopsis sp. PS_44_ISF1]|uniref:arginase family protein n=1 Tax=Amycolatopsis sp. PS_44_ISF1 TaxID=2974917 RepID=UPI0028DE39E3|nr:arginase family protein [Amycolatopsis sp. PS_44_ISF1]MDT8915615.1 arginase family protein [Amycolatopsis sp. PS_44_ISF1]
MLINAVPQWQGAIGPRASGLVDGCLELSELAGHVLGRPVRHVRQDPATSGVVDGVAHRAVLTGANRAAQLAALEAPGGPVLTIGGDCGVELIPIGVARFRHGAGLGVAWLDAHADLNTAESSPSGAFHGMVLRSLLGEGDASFAASPALEPGRVALFGARVFDPAEREALTRGLAVRTEDVPATLRAAGADRVYLHLDLDVLDPAEFGGLNHPEPGGLTISRLIEALDGLSEMDVVGAGITECVGTGAQLSVLEPVVAAVGRLLMRA